MNRGPTGFSPFSRSGMQQQGGCSALAAAERLSAARDSLAAKSREVIGQRAEARAIARQNEAKADKAHEAAEASQKQYIAAAADAQQRATSSEAGLACMDLLAFANDWNRRCGELAARFAGQSSKVCASVGNISDSARTVTRQARQVAEDERVLQQLEGDIEEVYGRGGAALRDVELRGADLLRRLAAESMARRAAQGRELSAADAASRELGSVAKDLERLQGGWLGDPEVARILKEAEAVEAAAAAEAAAASAAGTEHDASGEALH